MFQTRLSPGIAGPLAMCLGLCLGLTAPVAAIADGWDRNADFRIGKHDFGGADRRDISFYPRYWKLDACGLNVPVDRARWQISNKVKDKGWPRQRTEFMASEAMNSYTQPMDKFFYNPTVIVTYACGPSKTTPKAKLADFMSRNTGGSDYRVEWGKPAVLRHPDFGEVYFAPRALVYQSGARYSGVSAYWLNTRGDLVGIRSSIEEMNAKPDYSRLPDWNTAFTQQLILATKPLK